jgi:AraC family cel operon transcriptional repressor
VKYTRYDFDKIVSSNESKYIFQYVKNRKLTNIYHSHNFYEVCIILSGSATELFNGQKRLLKEGTVVILNPEDLHCFVDQSENLRLVCLSVKTEEALRLIDVFEVKLLPKEVIFDVGTSVAKLSNIISQASEEHHYKLLFCQILTFFGDNQKQSVPYFLKTAVQKMQRFENMRVGVPKLVELSGYSRSHLTRLIRRYYHCTLQELMTKIRLDAAYNEVILSKDSLEDIAYKVGYSSFSHFQKVFKKFFGITPAVLRKTNSMWTI